MRFEPAPDRTVGGRYRLLERLAGGGMGSVWLAQHEKLASKVAIKFMSREIAETPSGAARFEREAKATAQLSSPHVVRVQDFGVEEQTAFIVLELLEGEDLATRLDRVGTLSLEEARTIAVGVCKGLQVAHDAGIVHRDVKPRNIFIAKQGDDEVVKLVDFGVARETKTRLVDDHTTSGVVLGSPSHMSPEQASSGEVDARSDLWSLAVVLYRALTGALPFDGPNMPAVMLAIVSAPLRPLSERVATFSPAVDDFFAKALQRNPKRRFQSAREMAEAFKALLDPSSSLGSASARDPMSQPRTAAEERGREEPTVAAPLPAHTKDLTSGGEIGALTAGVTAVDLSSSNRARRRVRPVLAVFGALGLLGVGGLLASGWLSGQDPPPRGAETSQGLALSTTVGVMASVLVTPSQAAPGIAASATSSAIEVTVASSAPVVRPAPKKPPPANTPGCTRYDPFTGHCLR